MFVEMENVIVFKQPNSEVGMTFLDKRKHTQSIKKTKLKLLMTKLKRLTGEKELICELFVCELKKIILRVHFSMKMLNFKLQTKHLK